MLIRRLLIAAVLPVVLIAGPLAGSALAHVEVDAPGASEGGSGSVTFSAESEGTTPLTKLEVVFPADVPLAKVTVPPMNGWTSAVTNADSASGDPTVSRIRWTATAGGGIAPEKTGEFAIQVGQFPDVAEVVFKALVTYADGSVVSWIELQAPGGPEPEHPAPVLQLAPAAAAATTAAATVAITTAPPAASSSSSSSGAGGGGSSAPVVIGVIVVAALIVAAVVVLSRRRRQAR